MSVSLTVTVAVISSECVNGIYAAQLCGGYGVAWYCACIPKTDRIARDMRFRNRYDYNELMKAVTRYSARTSQPS